LLESCRRVAGAVLRPPAAAARGGFAVERRVGRIYRGRRTQGASSAAGSTAAVLSS